MHASTEDELERRLRKLQKGELVKLASKLLKQGNNLLFSPGVVWLVNSSRDFTHFLILDEDDDGDELYGLKLDLSGDNRFSLLAEMSEAYNGLEAVARGALVAPVAELRHDPFVSISAGRLVDEMTSG
jgi:hypothetical protein